MLILRSIKGGIMKSIIYKGFTIIFMLLTISMAQAKEKIYEMHIALGSPKQDYHFSWTPHAVLKNEIEKRSNGRIKVVLYPNGQLGGTESTVKQVRDNILQASDASLGHIAPLYPNAQILEIPYLFPNREVAWSVLDGEFGENFIEEMAKESGLRPLYWGENGGFRHFSNNVRTIRTPDDMKGLKIRVQTAPLYIKLVEGLGASATAIPWAEVYTSLQTGVVDGQENAITTFLTPKFEEVQKYMTLDGHVYSLQTIVVSEQWFQSLPEDLQNVIKQSSLIARTVTRGLTVSGELKGFDTLEQSGVEVYAPTNAEKELFRQSTQENVVSWLKENYDAELIDKLLAEVEAKKAALGY